MVSIWQIARYGQKYQDWSDIYQNRNEQRMKANFLLKYKVYPKSIKTEAVFTRQKWTMTETLIFSKHKSELKSSYDDISAVMTFFTHGIQVLQHWWTG